MSEMEWQGGERRREPTRLATEWNECLTGNRFREAEIFF